MFNSGIGFGLYGKRGYRWHDYSLFLPGDNGFLYDFSRADTLFQEATGTTPAGVDQNVGLALDISKWGGKTLVQVLAAQPELRDGGTTGVVGSATLCADRRDEPYGGDGRRAPPGEVLR